MFVCRPPQEFLGSLKGKFWGVACHGRCFRGIPRPPGFSVLACQPPPFSAGPPCHCRQARAYRGLRTDSAEKAARKFRAAFSLLLRRNRCCAIKKVDSTRKALQEKPGQWTSRYHCVNPGYNLQKKHCHVPPRVSREPNTCNSNTCALKTGGMSSARATTARAASATAARTSGVPPPRVSKTRPPTFGKACPERRGPLPLGAECVRAPTPLWKVVPITHRSSRARTSQSAHRTRAHPPSQLPPSLPPSSSGRGAHCARRAAMAELPRTGQH